MNRMSSANREKMIAKQMSGERSKKGQKRDPKDFDAVYRGAMQHFDRWLVRNASVSIS